MFCVLNISNMLNLGYVVFIKAFVWVIDGMKRER